MINPQTRKTQINAVYNKYFLVLGGLALSRPNTKQKQPIMINRAVVSKKIKLEFINISNFLLIHLLLKHINRMHDSKKLAEEILWTK